MLTPLQRIPEYKKNLTAREMNLIIDRLNSLSKIRANGMQFLKTSTAGIDMIISAAAAGIKIKIFEVQSAGTGDAIYNCYEQTLDATNWANTAGADKFNDLNSTGVEVMNLKENDPVADYTPALTLYDRIAAWQWRDDEGTLRWVGLGLSPDVRMVRAAEAAPAADNMTCNIILMNNVEAGGGELGFNVQVHAKFSGVGNTLDVATPYLANDDYDFAVNLQGTWYFDHAFHTWDVC